ncbi:MAG: hypothetical protein ACI4D4_06230 [Lachnospira sp.]
MKKFIFWFYLLIKRQLKNPAITLFLIAIPVAATIIVNVPELNKSDKPKVGLVVLDGDEVTRETVNRLINGDYSAGFYICRNVSQLKDDIMDGKAECGYIFGDNLKKKLDERNYEGAIEVIINKSNFISSMTNEIVFSSMFRAYCDDIAVNYIKSNSLFKEIQGDAIDSIEESYSKYLSNDSTFYIDFKMLDDASPEETVALEEESAGFPVRQILSILIYTAALFGVVQYYMDKEKGTFVTLSAGYRIAGKPLYAFIGAGLFALSSQITLIITRDANLPGDIVKMCLYVIGVTLFAWLLGTVIHSAKGMISVIPVLLIACMVLCPVFINLTVYVPGVKYIQKLLLPYYMM